MERGTDHHASEAAPVVRTVMFSDVVRSTELIDRYGDVAWFDVVERHARTVDSAARAHGGTVASFMGDGFMVLFDRPSDALACADRLHRAASTRGLPGLRIGIDHGEVYAFRTDWWVGLTIHTASRLTDLSPEGGIAISHRSLATTGASLPHGAVDARLVAIRGLSEPCLVHLVRPCRPVGANAPQPIDRPTVSSTP